jgi:hypothetical protein
MRDEPSIAELEQLKAAALQSGALNADQDEEEDDEEDSMDESGSEEDTEAAVTSLSHVTPFATLAAQSAREYQAFQSLHSFLMACLQVMVSLRPLQNPVDNWASRTIRVLELTTSHSRTA